MITEQEATQVAVEAGTSALAKRSGNISVEEAARVVLTAEIRSGAVRLLDDKE